MTPKTEFFAKHGTRLVKIAHDDPEGGDFMLFHPEEKYTAHGYIQNGFEVASVYETNSGDVVVIDNDISEHPFKIGYLVLEKS